MECFLIFLAVRLVASDKLDRTYLPPPGAKIAGGSLNDLQLPLEYSEERKPSDAIQNDGFRGSILENTFSESPDIQDMDKVLLLPDDFSSPMNSSEPSQTPSLTANSYDSVVESLNPGKISYDIISPKLPGYLSSQRQPITPLLPADSSTFKTPSINGITGSNASKIDAGYYYYIPLLSNNMENHGTNKVTSINTLQSELFQYPNQNISFVLANGQAFTPKPTGTKELVEKHQPSTFGYYGGNPMIMSEQNFSSKGLQDIGLRSKFGEFENVLSMMSADQDKQIASKNSLQPFQIPSVINENQQKMYEYNDIIENYTSPSAYTDQTKSSVSSPGYEIANENSLIKFEQRGSAPVSSRFRQERLQAESDKNALTLNYKKVISPEGYSYNFLTSNGIHVDESGTENNGVKTVGSYSYIGDDGKNYSVSYIADENGFQPIGDHLPTPPPVPEAIKKVIAQAAIDEAAGIVDDGSYDEKKYGHMIYQGAMNHYRPIKNDRIPNVSQRVGGTLSELNKKQHKPSTITGLENKKETNDAQIYKGYIPKNSSKQANRSQFQSTRTQYSTRNQQDIKNKLPPQKNKDGIKTSSIKNQENYLIRHSSSDKKDDHQNIHNDINTNNNELQENKATSSNGSTENVPEIFNNDLQNQFRQLSNTAQGKQLSPTGAEIHVDEGYYYVPPFIKFNEIPEQFGNQKNSFFATDKPAQNDNVNSILKRIGVDNINDQQITNNVNQVTSNTKSTRKPYITGPDDQNFTYEYTTPMPATKYKNQPTNEYSNQYYQTINNPAGVEKTLTSTVENKMDTPSEIAEFSVSQKIVATTNRPINLEVNQKVNIYGFGESKPTIAINGYLDKISNSNDGFIPNDESRFSDVRPTGNVFQDITEKGTIGNDHTLGLDAPADANLVQTGPYFNTDLGQDLNSVGILGSPVSIPYIFGNDELAPSQAEGITPKFTTQSQYPTDKATSDDFSGPKQPYGFNPETGYYYK